MTRTPILLLLCASMWGLPVRAMPVELIVNGSFETGDFTGWTASVSSQPLTPWRVGPAGRGSGFGMAPTMPQDGQFVAWNGFDGAGPFTFTLDQEADLPANNRVILSWKHRAQWNFSLGGFASLPRLFEIQVLDPSDLSVLDTVFSFSTGTQAQNVAGDTAWTMESADLSSFSGSTIVVRIVESIPQFFTGPAQFEIDGVRLTAEVIDIDGDGIPDDEDLCPMSDLDPTVVIDGCDSGVANVLDANGCTVTDLVATCAVETPNHGQYVSCVAHRGSALRKTGLISGSDKGAIQSCAARSSIGKY